jgi:hypothetical protein
MCFANINKNIPFSIKDFSTKVLIIDDLRGIRNKKIKPPGYPRGL